MVKEKTCKVVVIKGTNSRCGLRHRINTETNATGRDFRQIQDDYGLVEKRCRQGNWGGQGDQPLKEEHEPRLFFSDH